MISVEERQVYAGSDYPLGPHPSEKEREFNVNVIFTDVAGTRVSLKVASALALDLGARVTILAAQVVPYSLPLERPTIPTDFTQRTLRRLTARQKVKTSIQICLCRDQIQTIREMLKPDSIIVMGLRKHWWPTKEQSLLRNLRRYGFQVLAIETVKTKPVQHAMQAVWEGF